MLGLIAGQGRGQGRWLLVCAVMGLIRVETAYAQQVDVAKSMPAVDATEPVPALLMQVVDDTDAVSALSWSWGLLAGPVGWGGERVDAVAGDKSVGYAGEEDEDGGAGRARGREASGLGRDGVAGLGRVRSEYNLGALQLLRVRPGSFGVESFSVEGDGEAHFSSARARFSGAGMRPDAEASGYLSVGGVAVSGLRGSAVWLSEESALAAVNPYSVATSYSDGVVTSAAVKPHGAMNQFGVLVGLPVRLPGRFFRQRAVGLFGALEVQLQQDSLVSSPVLASFFALTPEQVALLGNRGVSAAATNSALNYLSSLTGTTPRSAWRVAGVGRADVALSKRDDVSVGYVQDAVDAPAGAALGQASDAVVARGRGSLGDSFVNVEEGRVRWEHRLSKRWVNEVRAQAVHDLEFETPTASLPQEPSIGPGGLVPQVSIGPEGFAYGTPANLGRLAYPEEQRIEVADVMRLQAGRHAFAVGGTWKRVRDRVASVANAEGSFLYDSGITNGHDGGLVDWVTDYVFNVNAYPNGGCPNINATVHDFCFRTYSQGFGEDATEFVMHDVAGFAEDAMRLRKDLLMTMGVRYDYTLLPLPQQPNAVLDAYLAGAGVGAQTGRFPEDRNNVGPRVSATYAPRWARGVQAMAGYGVFYGRVPGGTVRAALQDTALLTSSLHVRITPTTEVQCPQVTSVSQGFGYACAFTGVPPAAVAQTTSATVFAPSFRMPMVQRGTLMLEGETLKGFRVRVGYEMAYAKQLPASRDVNIAPASGLTEYVLQGGDGYPGLRSGETFAVPVYAQRLVSEYGAVTEVESHANAYYNAGTVEAQWRGERGLSVRGAYTFSRGIDDGPLQTATPSLSSQFDPFRNGYDKGLSSLQFPQRFAGALAWEAAVRRGDKRVQRALSGWRVSAVGSAGSGSPYSYTLFAGTRLRGGHETINGSGGATYLPTVGRNTLRMAPRGNVNVRVGREFAAGPRARVNAFVEAFNLFNERNISGVETRAFLAGSTATIGGGTVTGPQPLVFQDAAAIAREGVATAAFGTANSSTVGSSKERRVEFGVRMSF